MTTRLFAIGSAKAWETINHTQSLGDKFGKKLRLLKHRSGEKYDKFQEELYVSWQSFNLSGLSIEQCRRENAHISKTKALTLLASVHSQALRDVPTSYLLPYAGLEGVSGRPEEQQQQQQYYRQNRRSERIPLNQYQYDESSPEAQDYYTSQARQAQEPDSYSYQPSTPSQKDYEQLVKNNHLARLRVSAKKHHQQQQQQQLQPQQIQQSQLQHQQPQVEQYLKEVSPTTKTAYQRPLNYLRFSAQEGLKPEQSEEAQSAILKLPQYRYVLQPDLEQKTAAAAAFQQYQYETVQDPQESAKPKTQPFNLVAYQNALLAQQKLLAQSQDVQEEQKTQSLYVPQSSPKKATQHKSSKPKQVTRPTNPQYDYYQQIQAQLQAQQPQPAQFQPEPAAPVRYQQRRPAYQKQETSYSADEDVEQYHVPSRTTKQQKASKAAVKYEVEGDDYSEENAEDVDYRQQQQKQQPRTLKYQSEEQQVYRRPSQRKHAKPQKYSVPVEEQVGETKQHNIQQQQQQQLQQQLYSPESLLQYQGQALRYQQQEQVPRRQNNQYEQEPRQIPRYTNGGQFQEETQQLPHYHSIAQIDSSYQQTAEVPVRYRPGGNRNTQYRPELQSSGLRYYKSIERPTSYVE